MWTRSNKRCVWGLAGWLGLAAGWGQAPALVPFPELGLAVAPGFAPSLFADNHLAADIHAMTLNQHGHVVVSGPGYIKILHDYNGDGVADEATVFAEPQGGAMGLCFDGPTLYATVDGWLCRYRDDNGDGRADGPPERLFPLQAGEHGGHAVRRGPDGWFYVIGGNDARINRGHATLDDSPVRVPEAGALLRVSPDGKEAEVLAHGFRNPYDFDFNWLGDLFTFDSDNERDYLLPWYSPARLYHVAHAQHHGWRLPGYKRGWARPGYYADTPETLEEIGRASPTGVACYRHRQFPEHYHDGLFALDWTFGRIFFTPLEADGASYAGAVEVFAEPLGTHGFAPTDLVVAPNGSLLVSIGGRRTRGAVFRFSYTGFDGVLRTNWQEWLSWAPLERTLRAPQPLEAWSRELWLPLARQLGEEAYGRVVADPLREPEDRVRAIEILTDEFGGLSPREAQAAVRADAPEARARAAWSLGRWPTRNFTPLLLGLAGDPDPLVRRCALESLADRYLDLEPADLLPPVDINLGHPDKRVRLAAARLAAMLPTGSWAQLKTGLSNAVAAARLTGALAAAWRQPELDFKMETLEFALSAWKNTTDPLLRLDAVRLMILALGDYRLENPTMEAWTGFEPGQPLRGRETLAARIRQTVRPAFPSAQVLLNVEVTRLLAMVGDSDPTLLRQVSAQWTPRTTATLDFHYLAVLSRLGGARPAEVTARAAAALTGLDRKLAGEQMGGKQNWNLRLAEIAGVLLQRDPALGEALLRQPDFVRDGNLPLALLLDDARRKRAAAMFLQAVKRDASFPWSASLITLLGQLPMEETRPFLRAQWARPELRDELLLKLAGQPEEREREMLLAGLDSTRMDVAEACVKGLLLLPRDDSPRNLAPVARLLAQLAREPRHRSLRRQTLALFNRQSGQNFLVKEDGAPGEKLESLYRPPLDWFRQTHPALARQALAEAGEPEETLARLLKSVDWKRGRPDRGEALFHERGCSACHAGNAPLGPDLRGITGRYSATDLFLEIAYPGRNLAEDYRPVEFRAKNGETHLGLVVFESAQGWLIQTGPAATLRLDARDILSHRPASQSLMPVGLLRGLLPYDLADLYAYLKTLAPKTR